MYNLIFAQIYGRKKTRQILKKINLRLRENNFFDDFFTHQFTKLIPKTAQIPKNELSKF